ncbi:MAG: DUF1987 domain-containing protein [Cyclobacteriaceae bacterium]|nr:DUF1987 domain-containing protein [Cyclobacteriaceae bacterium]MCH8516477.1 DUF1987 domain-containing protein [Cyclobacteriaceae bacterium]
MKDFYIEETSKTPRLRFELDQGVFEISGRSIPENSIEFYQSLMDWLDDYIKSPLDHTVVIIKLEYFNTSSSKCLVEIFRKLEEIQNVGKSASIKWYFDEEDEDMEESGEDFKEIIKLPIEMIMISEED